MTPGGIAPAAGGRAPAACRCAAPHCVRFTPSAARELKTLGAARDKGVLRLEGKEYVVLDGDVVHFRFAV